MNLAKFFHRPPGDDDRELLLITDSDLIIGSYMDDDKPDQRDDFLHEKYPDATHAIAAYRRHARELASQGYFETAHTDYMLRKLLPDPKPKPEWQKALDDLVLAALGSPLDEQARLLAAVGPVEAVQEPLCLCLAADARLAGGDHAEAIRLARQGHETLVSRRAAGQPSYAWSLDDNELEAQLLDVLSSACLDAGADPAAALDAAEAAYRIAPSQDRGVQCATILHSHFQNRREEAFDAAFSYADFGGYEFITGLPAYARYLARRKRKSKSNKGWRWKPAQPSPEADLLQAEAAFGAQLPDAYRSFLASSGPAELLIRLPAQSCELRFYPPSDLATKRSHLYNFIVQTEPNHDEVANHFRKAYDVSLHHLVPVAEPVNQSSCLLIHLGTDHFGKCFFWDHDDPWELDQPASDFDTALKRLTDGIAQRDATVLRCLGLRPEEDEAA